MVFARGGIVAGGRQTTAGNDHSRTMANHIADRRFTAGAFTPVLCSSGGDALCRPNGMIGPFCQRARDVTRFRGYRPEAAGARALEVTMR